MGWKPARAETPDVALAAEVTPKLWETSDMVKALEDWEVAN
jgi:hypothetical protein